MQGTHAINLCCPPSEDEGDEHDLGKASDSSEEQIISPHRNTGQKVIARRPQPSTGMVLSKRKTVFSNKLSGAGSHSAEDDGNLSEHSCNESRRQKERNSKQIQSNQIRRGSLQNQLASGMTDEQVRQLLSQQRTEIGSDVNEERQHERLIRNTQITHKSRLASPGNSLR